MDRRRLRLTPPTSATADESTRRWNLRPLALLLADDPATRAEALEIADEDLAQRTDREAWVTRAWVLSKMGRHDEAVVAAERALAWGAPEPEVLWRAGEVFVSAGQETRARGLLTDALDGRGELGPVTAAHIQALLD